MRDWKRQARAEKWKTARISVHVHRFSYLSLVLARAWGDVHFFFLSLSLSSRGRDVYLFSFRPLPRKCQALLTCLIKMLWFRFVSGVSVYTCGNLLIYRRHNMF